MARVSVHPVYDDQVLAYYRRTAIESFSQISMAFTTWQTWSFCQGTYLRPCMDRRRRSSTSLILLSDKQLSSPGCQKQSSQPNFHHRGD